MALADYKLCTICDAKTFYDANVDYEEITYQEALQDKKALPIGVGSWAVLCKDCAETHAIVLMDRRYSCVEIE